MIQFICRQDFCCQSQVFHSTWYPMIITLYVTFVPFPGVTFCHTEWGNRYLILQKRMEYVPEDTGVPDAW